MLFDLIVAVLIVIVVTAASALAVRLPSRGLGPRLDSDDDRTGVGGRLKGSAEPGSR